MPKRVITTARYHGDAAQIFQRALEPSEVEAASAGYATFVGMPDHLLREGDTYILDVTTLWIFRTKGYQIHMHKVDPAKRMFISHEKGGLIKSWIHEMSVSQDGELAIWTDDVTIDAGIFTSLVSRIASGMYRHRHKNRGPISLTSSIV